MHGIVVEPRMTGRSSSPNEPNASAERDAKAGLGQSFLLRFWSSSERGNSTWHASLEDPHTGERIGFADLEHLFAYLMELTEKPSAQESTSGL